MQFMYRGFSLFCKAVNLYIINLLKELLKSMFKMLRTQNFQCFQQSFCKVKPLYSRVFNRVFNIIIIEYTI